MSFISQKLGRDVSKSAVFFWCCKTRFFKTGIRAYSSFWKLCMMSTCLDTKKEYLKARWKLKYTLKYRHFSTILALFKLWYVRDLSFTLVPHSRGLFSLTCHGVGKEGQQYHIQFESCIDGCNMFISCVYIHVEGHFCIQHIRKLTTYGDQRRNQQNFAVLNIVISRPLTWSKCDRMWLALHSHQLTLTSCRLV